MKYVWDKLVRSQTNIKFSFYLPNLPLWLLLIQQIPLFNIFEIYCYFLSLLVELALLGILSIPMHKCSSWIQSIKFICYVLYHIYKGWWIRKHTNFLVIISRDRIITAFVEHWYLIACWNPMRLNKFILDNLRTIYCLKWRNSSPEKYVISTLFGFILIIFN